MKKFLAILILNLYFITTSQADNIKDLQIEGISVGDNLLNHVATLNVTKDIIKNKKYLTYPNSNKFVTGGFKIESEKYDGIQFLINPKTFKIASVSGMIFLENKNSCEKKQKEIFKELSLIYTSAKIIKEKFEPHSWDKTGNSISNGIYLALNSGDIGIECYIWSEKLKAEKGWDNNIKILISDNEAIKFLTHEAY